MACKLKLLGKLVTAWQNSYKRRACRQDTHVPIQARVHPKGQLREKFHVTLVLQYQIILHSQMNQSSTVSSPRQ